MLWVVRSACLTLLVVACGDDDGGDAADAAVGVRVSGCDDPLVWTAPALDDGYIRLALSGPPCGGAQYPLSVVSHYIGGATPYDEIDRSCWRVVDASPSSGLATGEQFSPENKYYGWVVVTGFERPVTFEARALLADGTLAISAPPETVALEKAKIVEPDASGAIVLMTADTWAERNAVHLWGERIATDEIVDATAFPYWETASSTYPFTLHRTASGFVRTRWRRSADMIEKTDLSIGAGTRARIAEFGAAIVIDSELVLLGYQGTTEVVKHRIPLAAEPSEVVGQEGSALLHIGNAIVRYWSSNTGLMMQSMPVGPGVLLPAWGEAGYFFDGTRFHRITSYPQLAFDERWSFTPSSDDLARLGTPLAVQHGVVFGTNGLIMKDDPPPFSKGPGARFASALDLFGAGARIARVGTSPATYLVERDDGTAAIYKVPYADLACDP